MDDFLAQSMVKIHCDGKTLVIDWSRPTDDVGLVDWNALG